VAEVGQLNPKPEARNPKEIRNPNTEATSLSALFVGAQVQKPFFGGQGCQSGASAGLGFAAFGFRM
jgi:hypothetical protein